MTIYDKARHDRGERVREVKSSKDRGEEGKAKGAMK
jgi:hypothetical protein